MSIDHITIEKKVVDVGRNAYCNIYERCKIITYLRSTWLFTHWNLCRHRVVLPAI